MLVRTYRGRVVSYVEPSYGLRSVVVEKASKSKYVDPLDVYSAAREAELRTMVSAALRAWVAGTPLSSIVRGLESGDASIVLAAIKIEGLEQGLRTASGPILDQIIAAATGIADKMNFAYDTTRTSAVDYAAARAAALVAQIDDATRIALRSVIARAVRDGAHPYDAAPVIRSLIGLHERWANAVYNYWSGLVGRGDLSGDRISSLVGRYYDKLLTLRSETIARTEILDAANQGKLEGWRDAVSQGYAGVDSEKEWVAADDERTCPICSGLDGEVVGIDESFSSDDDMPPAHPSCRCTAALIVQGVETALPAEEVA